MLYKLFRKIFVPEIAHAHCDIPCGIYTAEPALTAAKTVVKMVEKIQETDSSDAHAISRFTAVKEEHAQICKEQLLILWTDYFKPGHLGDFPDLHETFWKTAKLCSKNKQEVNMEAAKELLSAVEGIAEMFTKTEQAKS
ncbi:superoxide dismutase, Ni [Patescibacteria group bacterium]|nr:superoxide dismutase, Ni [Patescibacteria group bacterium]